MPRISLNLFNV